MNTVLVVDDDPSINQMIRDYLTEQEYHVDCAYSGTEVLLLLERKQYDLILLDLMLPGMSGEEVLREVRDKYAIPVIAVSAKDDVKDKVNLLKSGAEDYLTKPFDLEELLVRIEVVLRRNTRRQTEKKTLVFKDLVLNINAMELTQKGQLIALTKNEYAILKMLMEHPTQVFTKDMIYDSIWNEQLEGTENAINVHISNIRKKLAILEPDQNYIKTVWGIGFKMEQE